MIVRSGTFVIHGLTVDTLGTTWFFNPAPPQSWYCTLLGPPVPAVYVAVATGSALLDTTTEGINLNWNPSPPGFTPTTDIRLNPGVGGIVGPFHSGGSISYGEVSFEIGDPDPDSNKFSDNPPYGSLFSFLRIIIESHGLDNPNCLTNGAGLTSPCTITGNYDIVYYWWTLPDKDACGNEQVSKLVFSATEPVDDPDEKFSRLDPDDPDAAPVPVILSLEPSHGRAGTRVAIIGSGFGEDAEVKFDGVAGLDIDYVSQYRIEVTAPAHANGFANIQVINPDGVST
jgi:IPT/TIG domain